MTKEQFIELYDRMVKEELEVVDTKGQEYTQGDQLDNFKRIGKELGIDSKLVLWVYFHKHIDSIGKYLKEGKVLSEPIEGRIKDARVYLALLRGLIEEGKAMTDVVINRIGAVKK